MCVNLFLVKYFRCEGVKQCLSLALTLFPFTYFSSSPPSPHPLPHPSFSSFTFHLFMCIAAKAGKHNANDQKCRELGWVCVPLAVETYGCWGEEAQCSVSHLAACLALQLQCSKSEAITNIYQRLNLTLVHCNARALLSRSRFQHAEDMG